MNDSLLEALEKYKFQLLEHGLEINEYKKENNLITIDTYERLLDSLLYILNNYMDSEEWNQEFKLRIGNVLGVKF
ncbi:hypothetical protein [Bacillus xiapuensis]|uniref:Uncharacterized protein n=1 Tax=Bacillus xiapuensis TaxID=2014075 RepID=A0ABU6N8Y0_9BACI|nr:hypothetical protein [Bacillus xiapuensis]